MQEKHICNCGCSTQICDCEIIHRDVVDKVRGQRLSQTDLKKMISFYKAFADGTRLKIIDILQKHEMCVCDLSVVLDMTKSAVSHQLKYLKELNIVKSRRNGKIVYYSLADEHVNEIFAVCLSHVEEIND